MRDTDNERSGVKPQSSRNGEQLFEQEVPELMDETVGIKKIIGMLVTARLYLLKRRNGSLGACVGVREPLLRISFVS